MLWLCIPVSDFCIELFHRFVYIQISHVQRKHKIKSDEFMYVVCILGHKKRHNEQTEKNIINK